MTWLQQLFTKETPTTDVPMLAGQLETFAKSGVGLRYEPGLVLELQPTQDAAHPWQICYVAKDCFMLEQGEGAGLQRLLVPHTGVQCFRMLYAEAKSSPEPTGEG